MSKVLLKPGREKSLKRRHPWVFNGAVARVEGKPANGETVDVLASSGELMGRGAWSGNSQMSVRMWTFSDEPVDEGFFRRKLTDAVQMRKPPVVPAGTTGIRLVHSESDGLPGFTADLFDEYLVCQISSAGAEFWKGTLIRLLREIVPCQGIYERSDLSVRKKEGLKETAGILGGTVPELVEFKEVGRIYQVNVRHGHKTGFYLDQRENRSLVGACADGLEVLDCFSYTGGFSVAALCGGASHVTVLDSSGPALEQARNNIRLNNVSDDRYTLLEADVFQSLRKFHAEQRRFGMIILDPPKFVETQAQIDKGARAYKDINRLAFHLLNPGGLLFTFSCSGHMEDMLFQKIVADAALDAGTEAKILRWLAQAPDHPVVMSFPEGKYLKGLMVIKQGSQP
jgi:23S rRNA (cytosine1962-C5)-methyltransferase